MTLSVLLTAFEPFGGRAKNASAEALAGVMQQAGALPGLSLTARLLPVEAGLAADQLRSALDEVRPDVLLSLGEAPRDVVCLEQMGYNERRFSIPDNAGNLLTDQPVDPVGPPTYSASLPLAAMLAAIQVVEVPVRLSDDPGRYLCNEVFYSGLAYAAQRAPHLRVGFIHVPYLPSAVTDSDHPSLPTDQVVRAVMAALQTLLA